MIEVPDDEGSDDEFISENDSDDGIGLGEKEKKTKLKAIGTVTLKVKFQYESLEQKHQNKVQDQIQQIDAKIQSQTMNVRKLEKTLLKAIAFADEKVVFNETS